MIDEPRDVAAHIRISHPAPIDLKAPDGALPHVPALAPETLLVRDFLSCVIDDPGVLIDALGRKDAPSVEFRTSTYDHDVRLCQFEAEGAAVIPRVLVQ
jgi:hypothetical protein